MDKYITSDIDQWMQDAGYEYHCFISWAHTKSRDITECAKKLKECIEGNLAASILEPRVFLDETEIRGGDDWAKKIAQALCKSVALVAVCAPIYYHRSHEWCGFEWAGMDMLSKSRLPNEDFGTIIPIVVKKHKPPEPISKIQFIDFSRVMIIGQSYLETPECKQKISEIVERIEEIAVTLSQNNARAECQEFQLPHESPFSDYEVQRQPAPFRS
jgi:hypothetical protein